MAEAGSENFVFDDDESFLDKYLWHIVSVGIVILIGAGVFAVIQIRQANFEEEAQNRLGRAEGEELMKIATEFPGTSAAAQALLLWGDQNFVERNYAEAKKAYSTFIEQFPEHPHIANALMGEGNCDLTENRLDAALGRFSEVYQAHPFSHRAPEAHYMAGITYQTKGDIEAAKREYETVKSVTTTRSPWRNEAQRQLARMGFVDEPPAPEEQPETAAATTTNVATSPAEIALTNSPAMEVNLTEKASATGGAPSLTASPAPGEAPAPLGTNVLQVPDSLQFNMAPPAAPK